MDAFEDNLGPIGDRIAFDFEKRYVLNTLPDRLFGGKDKFVYLCFVLGSICGPNGNNVGLYFRRRRYLLFHRGRQSAVGKF